QSNAANAEESASASEELNAQVEQVNAMIQQLIAIVGGSNSAQDGRRLSQYMAGNVKSEGELRESEAIQR
ncbi:MAG: methyl-accepting chemotaxis protein, partial [Syntrophaceae bacterium]|nr:methyl-accepting chemotaxis protein [Syntrophaceae bacterium]